ncbi:MAG: hypothetical protein AAFV53_21210 [Myxococcota bacterium]
MRPCHLLLLLTLAACSGDTEKTSDSADAGTSTADTSSPPEESVTLTIWGADAPPVSMDGLVFVGAYNTSLQLDNPAPALGTLHGEDPDAQARLDAYAAATAGAAELRIHRGDPPAEGALLTLSGCTPNPVVLDEVARLGSTVCAPEVLGREITFANVQLARVAPDGPFHIYEDYVVQTLPLFLDTGGCVTGAWVCDDDVFSGIFVPSYRTQDDIFAVASQTSTSGPGGVYGDATYAELRLGGVEVIVRHLIDVETVTP